MMKINRIFLTMTLAGLSVLTGSLHAQDLTGMKTDQEVYDSVQTARHEKRSATAQKVADENRMLDARNAQKETKAIAKEARRVDREASAAAREAKMAYRSERKAQKARKDADKQSRKADRAKNISDRN
jgi:hypothetical protein